MCRCIDADAAVQQNCCDALDSILGDTPELVSIAGARLVSVGCVDALLAAMRRHVDLARVVMSACDALSKLATSSVASRSAVVAAGGLEAVLWVMRRSSSGSSSGSSSRMQASCCRAIAVLAENEPDAVSIAALVLASMRRHSRFAHVALDGCDAIGALTTDDATLVSILCGDGVDVVVAAIGAHVGSYTGKQRMSSALLLLKRLAGVVLRDATTVAAYAPGMVRAALTAVRSLPHGQYDSTGHAAHTRWDVLWAILSRCAQLGCCPMALIGVDDLAVVVSAMRRNRPPSSPKAVRAVTANCTFLGDLAGTGATAASAIVDAGGMEVVLAVMRWQPHDDLNESEDLLQLACGVLTTLTVHSVAAARVAVGAGAIDAVVSAMRRHATSVAVQAQGCGALRPLYDGFTPRSYTVDAALLDVVLAAMQRHADSPLVQARGCALLRRRLRERNDGSAGAVIGVVATVVDVVVSSMRRHGASAEVQEHGCAALCSIANNRLLRLLYHDNLSMTAAGGVDVVMAAMARHPASGDVQRHGCDALLAMALKLEDVAAIVRGGGVELVVQAMRRHAHASSPWLVWNESQHRYVELGERLLERLLDVRAVSSLTP
jgi:hypothetical protein